MKSFVKLTLSLLFSLIFAYYAFSGIDWNQFLSSCRDVSLIPMLYVTLVYILQVLVRGVRWKYLINNYQPTTLRVRADSIMIANFVNFILPLRAGEFARPIFLANNSNNTFTNGFLSVILERLFDLITVLISYAVLVFFSNYNFGPAVKYSALSLCGLSIFILSAIFFIIFFKEFSKKLLFIFANFLPQKIAEILIEFGSNIIDAVSVLKNFKSIFISIFLSAIIWILTFWQYELSFLIFNEAVPEWFGILITVTVALAVAAPSAPGFIGVYQGAILFGFTMLGLTKEKAAVFSIITHAHQYLLVILYGLYLLFTYKTNFKGLLSKVKK